MLNFKNKTDFYIFALDVIEKIISKYSENKNISGTSSIIFSELNPLEQLKIIKESKGRNIIFLEKPKDVNIYETSWKYSGEIDNDFIWENFWSSVFNFTYNEFLKEFEKFK